VKRHKKPLLVHRLEEGKRLGDCMGPIERRGMIVHHLGDASNEWSKGVRHWRAAVVSRGRGGERRMRTITLGFPTFYGLHALS